MEAGETTDLCTCDEKQAISHIVDSCPLTKLDGGLSQLHSADDEAVAWLNSYSSWCTHKKVKQEQLYYCITLRPKPALPA